jgi:hypothetical protein
MVGASPVASRIQIESLPPTIFGTALRCVGSMLKGKFLPPIAADDPYRIKGGYNWNRATHGPQAIMNCVSNTKSIAVSKRPYWQLA